MCEFGTNKLTVKLSENSTITSGDKLIFKPWNNIREHLSGIKGATLMKLLDFERKGERNPLKRDGINTRFYFHLPFVMPSLNSTLYSYDCFGIVVFLL